MTSDGVLQDGAGKKRRIRKPAPFQPGFLRKIRVWNFTTYSYTEFNLSPTLNMILGPNGTGKSTLVAAICIGFGGKIDLIKRKNLKSMIKTGHERSVIEITMENVEGKRPLVIKRDFSAKDTVWTIDRVKATEKQVHELRRKFNIQLDNLCHFLPQERVAEFAALSPEKLLLETERTLKDGHLLTLHEDLIDKDNKSQELKFNIDRLKSRLVQLHNERSKLEEEARKLEEYEKKSNEIKNHKLLVPFARWQDMKKKQSHLKEEQKLAKKRLTSFDRNFGPLKKNVHEIATAIAAQEDVIAKVKGEAVTIEREINSTKKELRKIQDEILEQLQKLESYRSKGEKKKNELDLTRREIQQLLEDRANLKEVDKREIDHLNAQFSEKRSSLRSLQEQLNEVHGQVNESGSNLKDLVNKLRREETRLQGKDKLDLLVTASNSGKPYRLRDESLKAHQMFRDIQDLQGKYFEAPVVSCNVTERIFASAIEKVIDNNSLFAFSTTSDEGYELITQISRENRSNTPLRKLADIQIPKPDISHEKLQALGFEGYLLDYISGPQAVLSMICKSSKLHTIPVTRNRLSEAQIHRLTDSRGNVPFKKFISGDTLFNIIKSKYGSHHVSYQTEQISRSNFFEIPGLSEKDKDLIGGRIKQYQNEIQAKKEGYQEYKLQAETYNTQIRNVKLDMEEIKRHLNELQQSMNNAAKIDSRINLKRTREKELERDAGRDYSNKIRGYEQRVANKYTEFSAKSAEASDLYALYSQKQIESKLCDLAMLHLQNRETSAKSLIEELKNIESKLKSDYQAAKAEYEKIKDSPEYQHMKEVNEQYSEADRALIAEVATPYLEAGTFTEDIISNKISHLSDELRVMSSADKGSYELLKEKVAEMEALEKDLPRYEKEKQNVDERIAKISASWERDLSMFIHQISLAFSKRFGKVASEGRVDLAKSERFKDWKLQIKVKFRDESELKILDNQSQSGGERAVSTIFYIMALQGLSDAPFRIVDEINQGMDPKNEQMAHRYLVHTACKNSRSQYFLVTPKLLTGLYYHPDMMVHCIFTGPLIDVKNNNRRSTGRFLDFANTLIAT
ncbi:uncharacterized protein LODBEIA_P08400 [Lodderomyces beijingensis]|uniref:Structural maintenance of chromosomes protein 5 n=1 Tax=Lodderomyces beijingensis TaxID=1775926 RepID=A0ABP0ZIH4_9ASCO